MVIPFLGIHSSLNQTQSMRMTIPIPFISIPFHSHSIPFQRTKRGQAPWNVIFPVASSLIWKQRNDKIFRQIFTQTSNTASHCLNLATEFFAVMANPSRNVKATCVNISWSKPPVGVFKLNTDGSSEGNPGKAGAGGLLRDHKGDWVGGFSRNLGYATSVTAEMWALRDGLRLARNLNLERLVVEVDAQAAVSFIQNDCNISHPLSPTVNDCRLLMEQFVEVETKHVYREANACANVLAKMGGKQDSSFVVHFDIPNSVVFPFTADARGVSYPRLLNL